MPLFVDPDISVAKTLPKEFYLQEEYFQKSRANLFASVWQFIGDTDQVKDPGWVTPLTYLESFIDESLILTKDKEETIHCLSNVCTHRGNLIIEKPCKLGDLRCRYHGRRFHLDGKFLSMPEFKEVKNFPTASDNLHSLPVFQWGKWLFTSLHPAQPPDGFFKEMVERVKWMPFEKFSFRPDLSRDYLVDAHWALYCENFLEGFHIPYIHAGLNSVIDYGNYSIELFPNASLQIGIAKDSTTAFDLPPSSPDYGKLVASYYFWIFPNMMFNFYPWGLSINLIQPLGISKTKIKFLCYVMDESKLRQGAGANLNQVELEDEAIVENVQKGIRSRFYQYGRYSVSRESGTHHFHQLISKFMNQ